jgi:hypothetical protein
LLAGKSFVGGHVGKVLYDTTNETILFVCFTNHALDDALLHLVKHGVPLSAMVRIGGGAKVDPRLDSIRLRDLAMAHPKQGQASGMRTVTQSIEQLQDDIEDVQREIRSSRNLLRYLERYEKTWAKRFKVHATGKDGMQMAAGGKKGKGGKKGGSAVNAYYLLNAWQRGLSAEASPAVKELLQRNGTLDSPTDLAVWSLSKADRLAQEEKWREDQMGELLDKHVALCEELEREQLRRVALKRESDQLVLQSRRIIGMTTTAAAIYRDLLESVNISTMVVEEAGEILEAHVLTALSSQAKHLILIGDHQQLRPKVNHYPLQVESGRGYNLNCSLFERLAKADFPLETLHRQHRMHPHIAQFVKTLTYPDLESSLNLTDATRPFPLGLQHRITFVDHRHLEDSHAALLQRNEGEGTNSKVNSYEVNMILRTLVYMLQQGPKGYTEDNIVILTPYLVRTNKTHIEHSAISSAACATLFFPPSP